MAHKRANHNTNTDKGTYVIACDRERLYAEVRHTDAESVKAEAKRLAKKLGQRVLILKVVGVVDRRTARTETETETVAEEGAA